MRLTHIKSEMSQSGWRLAQHPLRELLYRAGDPRFLGDAALRVLVDAWHSVSPHEFSLMFRRVRPYTMCSSARLRGLHTAVCRIIETGVAGDLVECGCARGGSAALLGLTLKGLGVRRPLWLFDTFEGLPAPSTKDPDFEIAKLFTGDCAGSLAEVQQLFQRFEIADDVHFVKGLFQETLPVANIREIAVLHIDGDWYYSVKSCLENLYDKVSPGGVIQFDDYGYWKGARKAVDEFFRNRGVDLPLERLDYSGRLLIKPA